MDPATEAGSNALRRLETELIGWMTTVNPDGQPQSSAIWFLWQDGEILIYSHIRAPRNGNVEANPRVSFNLNTDPDGDEVVTMEGEARIDLNQSALSANPAYLAKYRHMIDRYGWSLDWLAANYPVPIVLIPTRWRLG
jgi:PPOX class probable F420-dependent enzyme